MSLRQPINRVDAGFSHSATDQYCAQLVGAEIELYARRNALDPYDLAQLEERMAVERLLNTKLLSRWEATRPANAESLQEAVRSFMRLCQQAEQFCTTRCSVVANMPCDISGHHRRFPDNLATNEHLVDIDGRVGVKTHDPSKFCNAVVTHSIGQAPVGCVGVIQIQGCETSPGFDGILQMATAYATTVNAQRIFFVNVAGTQIPPYFELSRWADSRVSTMASTQTLVSGHIQARLRDPETVREESIDGIYVEYGGWPDGLIVPPDMLQKLAGEVVCIMAQEPSTLLVVGCNAGKDRSGLVNALAQLELLWRKTGVPDALAPDVLQVVARIQQARPEALRTVERFKLLFLAAELVARRIGTHKKASGINSDSNNKGVKIEGGRHQANF